MSEEQSGVIKAKFKDKTQGQRFLEYFLQDSRPDFEEDVPNDESHLVDMAEVLEYAEEYEWLSDSTLYVWFEFEDDPKESLEGIGQIAKFFDVQNLYGCFYYGSEYGFFCQIDGATIKKLYELGDNESIDEAIGQSDSIRRELDLIIAKKE